MPPSATAGFSFTAAYSGNQWDNSDIGVDFTGYSYLLQVGYLFPDTAWEIAARYDAYDHDFESGFSPAAHGVRVRGELLHRRARRQADARRLVHRARRQDGNYFADTYAGYNATFDSDAMLIRFQWQLAL